MFKRSRVFFLLVMVLAVVSSVQALPSAPWYVVAHDQCADTLHWISPSGEAASIPRPPLPDEAPTAACSQHAMHISRDGRYMVQTGELNSGRMGIGFYDLNAGQWLEVHQTQPNEIVQLGHRYSSDDSNHIAIGFANTGLADIGWRVIRFDMTTGAVLEQLRSETQDAALSDARRIPYVLLVQDGAVHFRLDPFDNDAEPIDALAWTPGAELDSSPFDARYIDLNPDGRAVFTAFDSSYPAGPDNDAGVIHNTVSLIQDGSPTLYFADGVSRVYAPHLAADGAMLVFQRITEDGTFLNWIEIGGSVLNPLPQPAALALGVPDGFVFTSLDGLYFMGRTALDPVGPLLEKTNLDLIWATPFGSPALALDTPVGSTPVGPAIVTATPRPVTATPSLPIVVTSTPAAPVVVTATPPPAVVVTSTPTVCQIDSGGAATVNIRSGPTTDYAIIGEIIRGTPLQVIGVNGSWYVVRYGAGQGWVAGWVTTLAGDCSGLPFVAAPPVPTAGPTDVPPTATITFYADDVQLFPGDCTRVHWQVENIHSVFFEGGGVIGVDSREVCPATTTTYTLLVNLLDGTSTTRTLTIEVLPAPSALQPDLYVSEFALNPATPVRETAVQVRVGVYNQGDARATESFRVEWYPGENYPSPGCSWWVDGLAARGGRILTCTYSGYPSHYPSINTMVRVDTTNSITESDESNNSLRQAVTVTE